MGRTRESGMKSIMDLTARERRYLMLKLAWSATDMLDEKREMRNRAPLNRELRRSTPPSQLDIDVNSQVRHPLE